MDAYKRTKKELVEEVRVLHSRLEQLGGGKVKHKQTEDALKESEEHSRIFASYQHTISQLREFYVREATFDQMLQKTVDLFVKNFGYYMTWYGELESDEKVIIPKVWAGKYEKYLDGLRLELDDSKDAKCAMSLAIVNKEPFGYADLEHDEDFEKWRPLALKYGYRSNQAIPLVIDGKSVGAFLVYSTRPRAFSEDVVRYIAGIANELATIVENITERKKAEEALRESEEKYRSIFNTAASLITSVDGNGIIVDCNARIEDLLGYKKDEVARQSIAKIIHPDYMQQARACLNEILVDGFAQHKEYKMVRKDNVIIDVEVNAAGVKDKEGKYVGGICIIEDITERKEAEEERVAAVQERAAVVDAMSDPLVVLNLDGEIISCNPAHLKMFGHSSVNEISERHFSDLREVFCDPEEDIPRMLRVFKRIIQNGSCEPVEVRVRRVDGKELTVSASCSLQRDAMGNPLNVVVILRDITPQKQLQEMEREAAVTRMAVETIEGMLEGVAIMDLDGTIRQVNSEFERRSGYKREEAVGKKAIELGIVSKKENQRIEKEIIPKLMNEGLVRNIETVTMSRDGTRFSVLMSWRLMKDAQGNPKRRAASFA